MSPGRVPSSALLRMALTGIYLVSNVPRDLQRAARSRATRDKTTLRRVLVRALREYADGTWTPRPDAKAAGDPIAGGNLEFHGGPKR